MAAKKQSAPKKTSEKIAVAEPSRLVTLPNEIQSRILGLIGTLSDKWSLIYASKKIYTAHHLDIVHLTIAAMGQDRVFGLSTPVEGYPKKDGEGLGDRYRPFIFTGEVERKNGDLMVGVYLPEFLRENSEGQPGDINVELNEVEVTSPEDIDDTMKKVALSWNNDCNKKVVIMTGQLIRKYWKCPECNGERSVCPGCGGKSERWPDHFASCGWDMPCPCCVGYMEALKSMSLQDDEEGLDKMWKKINRIL